MLASSLDETLVELQGNAAAVQGRVGFTREWNGQSLAVHMPASFVAVRHAEGWQLLYAQYTPERDKH